MDGVENETSPGEKISSLPIPVSDLHRSTYIQCSHSLDAATPESAIFAKLLFQEVGLHLVGIGLNWIENFDTASIISGINSEIEPHE